MEAPSFQQVVEGWTGLIDVDTMTQPVSPIEETHPVEQEEEIVSSQKTHISISLSPVVFSLQALNQSELSLQGNQV